MAYIYEYIRTRGFEPLFFEEHFARLDGLSRRLFLAPIAIEPNALKREIAKALQQGGCSPRTANAVRVQCSSSGKVEFDAVDILYNDFSLRALRPEGYLSRVSGELIVENTSVKEALIELNRAMAQISDEGVAIWVDEQGEVLAMDGAPVVAVFDGEVRFSRLGDGVEFDIAYSETAKLGYRVSKGAIMVEELRSAKELLCIDYRGVTAIYSFDSRLYMDIVAEKIAQAVADVERR